jgi:iron complex outermembrane recepter protein
MKHVFLLFLFSLVAGSAVPQNNPVQVSGIVIDKESGDYLIGAIVKVKGSTEGSSTDLSGKFSFTTAQTYPLTLEISSNEYDPVELIIQNEAKELVLSLSPKVKDINEVVVTARRRDEKAQDIPIPIAVLNGAKVAESGSFNVNRVKELVPSVQLYSSNPRNTTLNIRGLGSTYGLTNDGVDPGVGFYVDGVYYSRAAATTLDFIDIEQIEVLRGPQSTLFGKNTTAGSFNITSKKPLFKPGALFEISYGNYGFIQAKVSVTGPLNKKLATRISFSGTQRDGTIYNVSTGKYTNDLNNQGAKIQFLYKPTKNIDVLVSGDYSRQRPDGYAQVIAGVVQTQRAGYRQFDSIIADLNYQLPSKNPFDRKIDHNTTWKSNQDFGGASINADFKIGKGKLTSTTAWRAWNWDPSNDRDFTGLPVLTLSQAPSKHQQYSQEFRYSGEFLNRFTGVVGAFFLGQELKTAPYHTEESGAAQWRFSQSTTSSDWETPGLFEGYGIRTYSKLNTASAALFGQLDYKILPQLHFLVGARYNLDEKKVDYNRVTYGGLETTDPDLIKLKKLVYTDQAFNALVQNRNVSGQLTLNYKAFDKLNAYATFSTNYKPVGVNLGGLPTQNGRVMTELAIIRPEYVQHFEVGVKTTLKPGLLLNVTAFNTEIKDYQTQVQAAELGVNRGYLANAEKVRVRGIEFDGTYRVNEYLSFYTNATYTEGIYVRFTNAPVPLEETGGASAYKDVSGTRLPGISKWIASGGAEVSHQGKLLNSEGRFFFAFDTYYRSEFSSSASESKYLNVEGYSISNARIGFRTTNGISVYAWGRNILNKDYFEQLLPAAGNAGQYAAVLGDPATVGLTVKYSY